jgi:hypothetical protein
MLKKHSNQNSLVYKALSPLVKAAGQDVEGLEPLTPDPDISPKEFLSDLVEAQRCAFDSFGDAALSEEADAKSVKYWYNKVKTYTNQMKQLNEQHNLNISEKVLNSYTPALESLYKKFKEKHLSELENDTGLLRDPNRPR